MDSTTLTQAQAKRIHEALFPALNYLVRLQERMIESRFPQDDDLLVHVQAAYEAVFRLRLKVHVLSSSGMGGPRPHSK